MTRATVGSLLFVILLMHLEWLWAKIPFFTDHTLHCAIDLFLFSSSALIYMMLTRAFVLMPISNQGSFSRYIAFANGNATCDFDPEICTSG